MKYWMFQNNQVTGPYEIDDLPTVAGYCAETLVCPEGRKGTNMGDWQRASMVPELSVSLLKVTQLATVLKGAGGIMGGLPPEPTLKDLAALGSLQERMELLDNTVAQLQESLKLKDQELLSVHRELEEKERLAKQMAVQLGGLEQRLGSVNDVNVNLKEGLDKAFAAEHEVESTVQSQARTIEELTKQLADLQGEKSRLESAMAAKQDVEDLKAQIQEIKDRPAPAAAPSPSPMSRPLFESPKPAEGLPSLDMPAPGASPFGPQGASKPLSDFKPAPLPLETPAPAPSPAPAPAPGGFTPIGSAAAAPSEKLGAPSLSLAPAPSPIPETVPPPATPAPAPLPMPGETPAPSTGSVIAAPSVVSTATPAPAAKGKPNVFLFIVLGLGAVGGFAAVKLGLLGGKKGAPAALTDRAPLPPPTPVEAPPPPKPPTPSPEEILEGKKKDAIALVDGWALANGKTVGLAAAEGTTPSDGAATPWMAEPMTGKPDVFQVNFYAAKAGLPSQTYEFEADLAAKKVVAHNAAAKDLIEGKTTAPKKKRGRRGPKAARPKASAPVAQGDDKPILEDLLIVNPDDDQAAKLQVENAGGPPQAEEPAAPKKSARKSRIKPRNDIQDLDAFLSGASEPAPKVKVKAKEAPKEESLDDLLVPGAGGKNGLDEPQAQAAPAPKDDSAAEAAADETGGAAPQHPEEEQPKKKGADEALDDLLKP